MSTQAGSFTSYDEVPFPSQPLPQSHPDRLAAVAQLFGLTAPPVRTCRVLELGCGTGGNLIPMAERHPESRFVGIDLSERQVAAGRAAIEALGLANIELRQQNIADLDAALGPFDYILCHGVFSWVKPAVQEQIFKIIRLSLAPQGVAYVSYNTFPGWHLRGVLRTLAWDRAPAALPAAQRIARVRELLGFFSRTLDGDPAASSRLLKDEIDVVLKQDDAYLFHEYLEDQNYPLYFHEFAARAASHGLQYLGEATPAMMFAANFGPAVEQQILNISNDVIAVEQHMDLLRNRGFRQTLLCHSAVPLTRFLSSASLHGLNLCGRIHPESVACDIRSNEPERFVTPTNSVISTPSPVVKAALFHLGSHWPRALSLEKLVELAAASLGSAGHPREVTPLERSNLGDNLVQCIAMGLIEVHADADAFVTDISPRPRASGVARAQALATASVTNRRHESVQLDQVTQNALAFLDGQHDRDALFQELLKAVNEGRLSILRNGIPATRGEIMEGILQKSLVDSLTLLAQNALLVE